MSSFRFNPGRLWIRIIAGAVILASYTGYRHLAPSAEPGAKLTILDLRGRPSGIFGRQGDPGAHMMAIFDPETHPTMSRDALIPLRMAPRLDGLDNKMIYLVDTGFAGGREFLEEVQAWFGANMPSVKTILHIKSGNAFSDSPELWAELKKKADGLVFGVGG
jgi:hypothetical protein